MVRIRSAPDSEESWAQFEANLAAALSDLAEDAHLVILRKGTDYFVQFAAQGCHGMRAESVSNTFIRKSSPLSRDACHQLTDLGWNPPTYAPSDVIDEPSDGSSNYYVDAATPVPCNELARLAVESLRAVYGVRHPGELQYSGCSADGSAIRVPLLKIRRENG